MARIDTFVEGFRTLDVSPGIRKIVDFLPDPGDALYSDVLVELVRIDLEFHWRNGQPKMVEAYLVVFPALADDSEVGPDRLRGIPPPAPGGPSAVLR